MIEKEEKEMSIFRDNKTVCIENTTEELQRKRIQRDSFI